MSDPNATEDFPCEGDCGRRMPDTMTCDECLDRQDSYQSCGCEASREACHHGWEEDAYGDTAQEVNDEPVAPDIDALGPHPSVRSEADAPERQSITFAYSDVGGTNRYHRGGTTVEYVRADLYEAQQSRIAELEGEVERMNRVNQEVLQHHIASESEQAETISQLRDYTQHEGTCVFLKVLAYRGDCDCGLDELIAALEGTQ